MTIKIFLLVCAVAQLASPAVLHHTHQPENKNVTDLKMIHDLVEKCIQPSTPDFFVDDVTHLTEGNNSCGNRFFCKVHNILHTHRNFCEETNRDKLTRTLDMYIKTRKVQCENATTTGEMIKISRVLKCVKLCAQRRILLEN